MRVILAGGGTGGHLFPGLAVAREFQRRDSMAEILFVGTEQGIEFKVLPREGFKLETLPVKGLKGRGIRGLLDALWGVPAGVFRSLSIIRLHQQVSRSSCRSGFYFVPRKRGLFSPRQGHRERQSGSLA
jgi:UDP-N-acetylglucosamine--N-acetylmuramyl-(pentapeptide) pyrophosphoryl-undecaprenol N-acetylglucosamine transferase